MRVVPNWLIIRKTPMATAATATTLAHTTATIGDELTELAAVMARFLSQLTTQGGLKQLGLDITQWTLLGLLRQFTDETATFKSLGKKLGLSSAQTKQI